MHQYRRPFSEDLLFVLSATLGWLICLGYINRFEFSFLHLGLIHWVHLLWSITTSMFCLTILYWVDHFSPFRRLTLTTDFIGYIITLPMAGILSKAVFGLLIHLPIMSDAKIVIGGVVPASLLIVMTVLSAWYRDKISYKYMVYLVLTPSESERFREILRSGGLDQHYYILSQEEFNGALASGGRVDYIIISRGATKHFMSHQNILQAQVRGVMILDYRTLVSQLSGHISMKETDIWAFLGGSVRQTTSIMVYRAFKFFIEPLVAAAGLIALLPLFIVIAVLIKKTSPGPVFFRQRRTGYLGNEFDVIKFRSMRMDAEAGGAQWATQEDGRVTAFGKFLRKSRIDELPQLWNVFLGQMSFLGPRPERPEFYELITKQVPAFKLRLLVRPGITGWAQVFGGYAASIEESERKLEYDLYYVQYMSPRMDMIILAHTFFLFLRGGKGR